jgi:hypothetical protein
MDTKRLAIYYSTGVGILMLVYWTAMLALGNVPEVQTTPIAIMCHVAAEALTAVALIAGAYGLLKGREWGSKVHALSLGMLIYTCIQSPGYFLQQGVFPIAGMFAVILAAGLYLFAVAPSVKVVARNASAGAVAE